MNMETKFREALLKVLEDGTFKNVLSFANVAGVDQGGLSKFLKAMGYGGKKVDPLSPPKDNMNLKTVSKLVDCMGGVLVFPWDATTPTLQRDLDQARKQLEIQEKELIESRAVIKAFKEVLGASPQTAAVQDREIKRCA